MEYYGIGQQDFAIFRELLTAYYREGEDAETPQAELDAFILFLFEKVTGEEIHGTFVKLGNTCIGFALWAIDTEEFVFSQIPGMGTILEIGFIPSHRSSGYGKKLVAFLEHCLEQQGLQQCYVSAYGPARSFWTHCGYVENGKQASNGLPIMVKRIGK